MEAQVRTLEKRRRWQPALLGALVLAVFAMIWLAGGATADPASWRSALPSLPLLLLFLPAAATPFLKHRALNQKIGIYRALCAMAVPSPTA